jgi:hypothetical protein
MEWGSQASSGRDESWQEGERHHTGPCRINIWYLRRVQIEAPDTERCKRRHTFGVRKGRHRLAAGLGQRGHIRKPHLDAKAKMKALPRPQPSTATSAVQASHTVLLQTQTLQSAPTIQPTSATQLALPPPASSQMHQRPPRVPKMETEQRGRQEPRASSRRRVLSNTPLKQRIAR